MTTKSRNLTSADQKRYVQSYKDSMKRMNFNGNNYLTIFKNAVKQYHTHKKKLDDYFETSKKNGTITLTWFLKSKEIELKMKHDELMAITFAALFLECLIWDYAAVNTSQSFTEDYLSQISLLGKWQVIPKLVNNDKDIDIGSDTIALLKKLKEERNDIIHSKSKAVPDTYDEIKKQEGKGRKITVEETVRCVTGCIEGLRKIDTTNYWCFRQEVKHTMKLPTYTMRRKKTKGGTILTS